MIVSLGGSMLLYLDCDAGYLNLYMGYNFKELHTPPSSTKEYM